LLVVLLIAFRLITASGYLPNFSPLPSLLLCSLIFFRGKAAWLLPVGAWVLTDPVVSLLQGYPVIGGHHLSILLGLSGALVLGLALRGRAGNLQVLAGSLASAFLFYFLTNTVSFLSDPLYAKTLDGFVRAQWTGPEGFAPTWVFLRNLLAANLLFSSAFLAARKSWMPKATLATCPGPSAER
jgi:hypothetical protein